MNRIIYTLLILAIGTTACWQSDTEPRQRQIERDAPSATPRVVDGPTAVSNTTLPSSTPTPTATPRTVSGSTAASNIPFPTAVPTSTPTPGPSPTPTPSPIPVIPTTTPTPAPTPTDEDLERMSNFMDNFKSISYKATFNMTDDRFTESGYLIAADVEGWVTTDPESQMFARINMTKPVERSIEVLTHSSFDVYLNDLDGGKWYFIPENSDAGPLEDILQLYSWGLVFSVLPTSSFEQSADGYVVTQGGPVVRYGNSLIRPSVHAKECCPLATPKAKNRSG